MFAHALRLGLGVIFGLIGYVTIAAVGAVAARSGALHVQSDLRPAIAADYSPGQDELVLQPLLPTILQAIEDDAAWFAPPGGGTLEGSAAGDRDTTPDQEPGGGNTARQTAAPEAGRSSGFDGGSAEPADTANDAESPPAPGSSAPSEVSPTGVTAPQATAEPTPPSAVPEPTATPDGGGTTGGATGGGADGGAGSGGGGGAAGGGGNSNAGDQGGNRDDGGSGNSGGNGGGNSGG